MSDRLTVVFDDPELYRRLKVHAAAEGIPMKRLIQEAIRAHLDAAGSGTAAATAGPSAVDWAEWDRMQQELDAIEETPSPDASDVKSQLYGQRRRRLERDGWATIAAEERVQYDAGYQAE